MLAAGAWVLFTFPPATSTFYPKCVFREVTSLDCPGCGTTRALHALLHGRIREAFGFNPMLFAMMLVGACAVPAAVRGEMPRFLKSPAFAWTSLAVVVAWWIVRNL